MEKMQDVISVIIPVYKVEKWLDQCISSIVNQTYKYLEIILVDDGSPDQCPQKCDVWAKKDNRIRVIHKENGGLSDARNAGLEICTGEWITFVDSDDWLHHQALEKMLDLAKSENVLLVSGSYQLVEENEQVTDEDYSQLDYERVDRQHMLLSLYNVGKSQVISCAKLYHSSLWVEHRFPVGKINEDEFTTYKLIYDACELIVTTADIYYYRMREGSITSNLDRLENLDILEALWERQVFFEQHNLNSLAEVNVNCILSVLLDRAVLVRKNGRQKSRLQVEFSKIQLYKSDITKTNCLKYKIYILNPVIYTIVMKLWRVLRS